MLQIKHGLGLGLFNEEYDAFMEATKKDPSLFPKTELVVYEKIDEKPSVMDFIRFCKPTLNDVDRGIIFMSDTDMGPFYRAYDTVDDMVKEIQEKIDTNPFDKDFDWEGHMGVFYIADSNITDTREDD